MIPHSIQQGSISAPLAYVAEGFYAFIIGRTDNGDYEWVQASRDSQRWWPYMEDWWPDFVSGTPEIPETTPDPALMASKTIDRRRYNDKGENEQYRLVLDPARELNDVPVAVGTLIWLMPTHCLLTPDTGSPVETGEDPPEGLTSELWLFAYADSGPYAVQFKWEYIPRLYDEDLDEVQDYYFAEAFFLEDPKEKIIKIYPPAIGVESQVQFEHEEEDEDSEVTQNADSLPFTEVLREAHADDIDRQQTRGWVNWVQRAYQHDDGNGNIIYFGQWQLVSCNSSVEFMATVDEQLLPSSTVEVPQYARLWWNKPGFAFFEDSGYKIELNNQTSLAFEPGAPFSIYYDKRQNRWFCYTTSVVGTLIPRILYDDVAPGNTGKNAWPCATNMTADTAATKVLLDNTFPGNFRGYGDNHTDYSATTAAKVWTTVDLNGNEQIVAGIGLAKTIIVANTASGHAAVAKTTTSFTAAFTRVCDDGQPPTLSTPATLVVYNPGFEIDDNAADIVCVLDPGTGITDCLYRAADAPCPAPA